jgi:hypothetical protein
MRAILVAGLVGIVVSACSLGGAGASSSRRSHIVPATLLTHFRGAGIQFYYPASWSHRHPGILQHFGASPVIDLSTQSMVDPCTKTGSTTRCGLPIHGLKPGGVVVTWALLSPYPLGARRRPLGVHVRVERPGFCRSVGGEEGVFASVVVRHHRVYSVGACLRGPNVAANERAVRAMLASAVSVD